MNVTISIIQEQPKWLAMLSSLVAGLMFAMSLSGQDLSGNAQMFVASTDSIERVEDSASLTPLETIDEQGPNDAQIVLTRNKCQLPEPVQVSGSDEIWLISARDAHLDPCNLSNLRCSQLQKGIWADSNLADLIKRHSADKSRATMIYVHGNRTDLSWADSRGLQFYQNAFQNRCLDRPPIRFVIFAWKAEREMLRPFPDFGIKSKRSVVVGKTFGELLCRFDDRNMLIGGFSLGAQIVLSGLSNPGLHSQDCAGKYSVAVFAPALDPAYASSGLLRYPCNPVVEQTKVFLNRADWAVKASQRIVRQRSRSRITTLQELAGSGKMGLNRIQIHDITEEVSKRHSIVKYAMSPELQSELTAMLNTVYQTGTPVAPVRGESQPAHDRLPPGSGPILEGAVVPPN